MRFGYFLHANAPFVPGRPTQLAAKTDLGQLLLVSARASIGQCDTPRLVQTSIIVSSMRRPNVGRWLRRQEPDLASLFEHDGQKGFLRQHPPQQGNCRCALAT